VTGSLGATWLVVLIRIPANPSRHRVAVWRELRRLGAIGLGGGSWATPAAPVFAEGLARVGTLVARAEGSMLTLDATPRSETDHQALLGEFNAARAAEWVEFASECDKFDAEIAKERRIGKYTLAELDEEEHSLDRLRRWSRDLKARDVYAVPERADADTRLKRCAETLEAYADEVYRAAHAPLGTPPAKE
jgi:ChrB-like protein